MNATTATMQQLNGGECVEGALRSLISTLSTALDEATWAASAQRLEASRSERTEHLLSLLSMAREHLVTYEQTSDGDTSEVSALLVQMDRELDRAGM